MATQQDLVAYKRLLRPNFFSYQQLTENIMLNICDSTAAQPGMLDLCRQYYSEYSIHINSIDEFAKTYQTQQAAHWYTKDSFVHRIVNKMLRAGNIEYGSLLRFYVTDLSEQLYELNCQQNRNFSEKNIILYRSLRQSEAHLNTLQTVVGHVILTKGFMSTSRDKKVALWYAGASHAQTLQSQSLLIEININREQSDIIVADIAHLSNFPDEQEFLFDYGTQFRVESLEYDTANSIWHCRLEAVVNESQVIQLYPQVSADVTMIDLIAYNEDEAKLERVMRCERRQKFTSVDSNQENSLLWCNLPSVSWIAFSPSDRAHILQLKALVHWHRTKDLRQFYSECKYAWEVLKQGINDSLIENNNTACVLNNFGYTCQQLKDTDCAIDLLKKASEIRQRLRTSEHFQAQSLRNLGLAYTDRGDYESALASLNQALIIGQQVRPTAKWSTSMTLRNFGHLYHAQGDYTQAAKYFSKALETFQQCANLCIEGDKI